MDERTDYGATDAPVVDTFEEVLSLARAADTGGSVADYIPELARADPARFGLAATTVHGRTYAAGDHEDRFTIQSISKPFVFALALAELGAEAVAEHVGVEPSGDAFNAISFDSRGRPRNPMINAGAIVTTSLVQAQGPEGRLEAITAGLSAFAGRRLEIDDRVYRSESATGDRNRALAMLASSTGVLGCGVAEAAEAYFQQCSLLVDCTDLAIMGATLSNHGLNPVTGVQAVPDAVARDTLSVMASCGMYDHSGQWIFEVGMPAKSGVGGGIVAVSPGQYGIGVFSPPLDAAGNSVRGVAALRTLSREFGLHVFEHPNDPASPVLEVVVSGDPATATVRVRGVVDFSSAEEVVHESLHTAVRAAATRITLDFTAVTAVTAVARRLLERLAEQIRGDGYTVTLVDPGGFLSARR